MGSLCQHQKRENLENYSKPINNQIKKLIGCNFSCICTKPSNLHADIFVVFEDDQFRLSSNKALKQEGQNVAEKAEEYIQIHIQESPMEIGDFKILPVDIEGFPFEYFGVLCAEIWGGGKQQLLSPLEEDIEEALDSITQRSLKNLVITEINQELGIPQQIAQKTLCRAVLNKMQNFDSVTILCKSQQSVKAHNSVLQKLQSRSNSISSKAADEASDYF